MGSWSLKARTLVVLVRACVDSHWRGFRLLVLGRAEDQFAGLNIKLCLENSGNVFMPLPPRVEEYSKDILIYA